MPIIIKMRLIKLLLKAVSVEAFHGNAASVV